MRCLLWLMVIISCATPTPDLGTPSGGGGELKPQLPFSVDGISYVGAATVQRRSSATVQATLPSKTALVVISTCARQDEFWQPDNSKPFRYEYVPAMFAENVGACPLSFIAVTAMGEFHRFIIDFTNGPKDPLSADIMCNGRWDKATTGAYICSVREGKPVRVQTSTKSVIARDPNSQCGEPKRIGGSEWEVEVSKGFCVYVAVNATQEFRLTTYGYSTFLKVYPKE